MAAVLDFAAYIGERTKEFTGREWVLAAIDRWLVDAEGPTFFIITGEPGVGKTALAAQLTQVRPVAAYHFCIARDMKTVDPVLFARSLARQLCQIDGFAQEILKESKIELKTVQNIQANYGQVIGARIENLVLNAPSGAAAFTHAVLQPLKALCADGFAGQVVLLVDALDEAVQRTGETIVDLLANAGALPRQVRVVLTSRPEGEVLRHFEERQIPHLRLDAGRPENLADLRRYTQGQVAANAALGARLAEQGMAAGTFVERVVSASRGNFLYLVWLLPAIAAGSQHFDTLAALPQGLDGIYRDFLRTRKTRDETQWRRLYEPVLGVLVAAQAPLTRALVEQFTGLSTREVRYGLQDLQQFLDPVSAMEDRYFLYHQSIRDWLQDERRAREFWVEVTAVHERIVAYYRGAATSWEAVAWREVDEYGLQYLAAHLYALSDEPTWREQFYALICRPLMVAKRERTGSQRAFAADVELALLAARKTPLNWPQVARTTLLYATLTSLASNVPPAVLGALAAVGETERALSYITLMPTPEQQVESYLLVGQALLTQGQPTQTQGALEQALAVAESIRDAYFKSEALRAIAAGWMQAGQPAQALAVAESIQNASAKARALQAIAAGWMQAGQPAQALAVAESIQEADAKAQALRAIAAGWMQAGQPAQALAVAESIQNASANAWELQAIAVGWMQAGQPEQALAVAESIQEADANAWALQAIAAGWIQAGQPEQAAAILVQALVVAESIQNAYSKSGALQAIAAELQQMVQAGQPEQAAAILVQALVVAESIQNAYSKSGALQAIAVGWIQAGQPEQAAAILVQALVVAESIRDAYFKSEALRAIAAGLEQMVQAGQPAQALAVAESIQEADAKAWALRAIAAGWLQAGQPEQAAAILVQARAVAESIWDVYSKSEALRAIAAGWIQAGQPEQALAVAESIYFKSKALQAITAELKQMVQAGQPARALAVAESIRDEYSKSEALRAIAAGWIQAGQPEQALAVAESIRAADAKAWALRAIAVGWLQAGQPEQAAAIIEQALTVAETIRSRKKRTNALVQIARTLAEVACSGLSERAAISVERLLTNAQTLLQSRATDDMFVAVVRLLTEAGRYQSLVAMQEAVDDNGLKAIAMVGMATCHLRLRLVTEARAAGLEAIALSRKRDSKPNRILVLCQAGQILQQVGAQTEAQQAIVQAEGMAQPLKVRGERVRCWSEVAVALASIGQADKANEAVKRALADARAVKDLFRSRQYREMVVNTLVALEQSDRARQLIRDDRARVRRIKVLEKRVAVLSTLARSLLAVEDKTAANEVIDQAREDLKGVSGEERIEVQAQMARTLSLLGRQEEALSHWQHALEAARLVGREVVLRVLVEGVPVLAAIDEGETLWQVYQAVQEVDSWWDEA